MANYWRGRRFFANMETCYRLYYVFVFVLDFFRTRGSIIRMCTLIYVARFLFQSAPPLPVANYVTVAEREVEYMRTSTLSLRCYFRLHRPYFRYAIK